MAGAIGAGRGTGGAPGGRVVARTLALGAAAWLAGAAAVASQEAAAPGANAYALPAYLVRDCKDAPADAVTSLPEPLARWAKVYCTIYGQVFTARPGYWARMQGSSTLFRIAATAFGKSDRPMDQARFTRIDYDTVETAGLKTHGQIMEHALAAAHHVWRLRLTADAGDPADFIVVDPESEVFLVAPEIDGVYGAQIDFVTRLAATTP
jgi:hypothetical protein